MKDFAVKLTNGKWGSVKATDIVKASEKAKKVWPRNAFDTDRPIEVISKETGEKRPC